MVRLSRLPIIVLKKELSRTFPVWAPDATVWRHCSRTIGGSKALRSLVEEGREAIASARPVVIYPEGTRVPVGATPDPKPGFAALYRALGLPVTPVAVDSGRLWGRGIVHRSGTIHFKIGETIPPALGRREIEQRVHRAINAFELGPELGT